jgi:hypothetical protein
VGWFVVWLDQWQTLLAGIISAVAVAGVALLIWWYERWHGIKQARQDQRRLARSLSLEIETIADRIAAGRRKFDLCMRDGWRFSLPEIARPFPVYSTHSRDLALFDDTTGTHVMKFYEGLPEWTVLGAHFWEHVPNLHNLQEQDSLPNPEQRLVRFSDRSLALADQLQKRLGAIATGREPPEWSDEWLYDKPYEPI